MLTFTLRKFFDFHEDKALPGVSDSAKRELRKVNLSPEPPRGPAVVDPYDNVFAGGKVCYFKAGIKRIIPRGACEGFGIKNFAACGILVQSFSAAVPRGNAVISGLSGRRNYEEGQQ